MTSTHWLLLGLAVLCAACLFAIFIGSCINAVWRNADEPIYRTADGGVMSADIRAALCNANASACTGDCNQGRHCTCGPDETHQSHPIDLQAVRLAGAAAGQHDKWQKPGTPPTVNPYPRNALAHVTWRRAYQRISAGTALPGTP